MSVATRFGQFVPGIAMLGSYQGSWFRPDFLAGLTVWAMLVPQSLGYASLAGMPAEYVQCDGEASRKLARHRVESYWGRWVDLAGVFAGRPD